MNLIEQNDNPENQDDDEAESSGTAKRRGARALKRKSERSSTLRRRKPASASPADDNEPVSQRASRSKARAKQVRAKVKPAKKRIVAKAKPAKAKSSAPVVEEYEIRSLPDGTQVKIKVTGKPKKPKRSVPRRKVDDAYGPGPVVPDLDSGSFEVGESQKGIYLGSIVSETRRSVTYLKKQFSVQPKVAVILGSGLSSVSALVPDEPIPFSSIPGFNSPGVDGHPGLVRAGMVGSTPTLICEGRPHYYETGSMKDTVYPVQVFMALGVERLILTTSAGGLNPDYRPGDIMFVNDQINMMGDNPLFGLAPDYDPSPFVVATNIYESETLSKAEHICRRSRVKFYTGTLAGMRGPVYETAAERAWLRSMGADAVCMSVIPEALAAAHLKVPVTAIALIVNKAPTAQSVPLSHELVIKAGEKYVPDVKRVIKNLLTIIG